jgi:hypothetical protein
MNGTRRVALNIIVYRERLGWAVKRGDQGRFLAWLRSKDDALTVGRAIAETEKLRLVELDHAGSDDAYKSTSSGKSSSHPSES